MISVQKAKQLIRKNVKSLPVSDVSIIDSLGNTLHENVVSPVNLPPFDQSAMDGYAIQFPDHIRKRKIKIIGEIPAGKYFKTKLNSGQAVRIYTGAPVPAGANAVIMQEKAGTENGQLIINDLQLKKNSNIRKKGSQIKKGAVALPKNTRITPGGIGYLAAMGVTSVKAIPKPRISVIVTGSELKKPGNTLLDGQIYESNSYAIEAALKSVGLKSKNTISVKDNENKLFMAIQKALKDSDIVLITGGISVGDYDFTGKSLSKLGVENIFYKIKQKPGKPLFFGKLQDKLIFGLPGNPAAVLSCFYEYVYPALTILQGFRNKSLPKIRLPIKTGYTKKQGLALFLKGKISNNAVVPLKGQESYMLNSFAIADCLIYLPAESENIKAGQLVEVHKLPDIMYT